MIPREIPGTSVLSRRARPSGHIGPEGVYLSSESQWYPDLDDSLATYDVTITVPDGWAAVTQGTRPG